MGIALSSTLQPPTVTISTSAALTSSSTITVARVACTTGLSRFGCVITTSWCSRPAYEDIATMTIQSRAARVGQSGRSAGVVEPVDTPALGAGGLAPLEVR